MGDQETAVVEADEAQSETIIELVENDVLVEEVSIDGMCGVY
jgi:mycofactocin precursor